MKKGPQEDGLQRGRKLTFRGGTLRDFNTKGKQVNLIKPILPGCDSIATTDSSKGNKAHS